MLLLQLNKAYFIIAGLLYLFFWFTTSSDFLPLYTVHIGNFLAYIVLLSHIFRKRDWFYTNARLMMMIFVYSLLVVSVYNYTSFLYSGNFFVFSVKDAVAYHYHSLIMASKTFGEAIPYYLNFYSADDLGMVLISSTLYRFIASNLFLNFSYIIVGMITALAIRRICGHFMSAKYSFLCAVTYALSSFVLWFHASGLKESFMCMLVVLFFDRYYMYMKNKNIVHLISGALFLLALLLFRTPLIFFCIGAVGLGTILKRRKGILGVLLVVILLGGFVGLYPTFESTYDQYLKGGDYDRVLMSREAKGAIQGGIKFSYAVHFMAQLIGPFPTLFHDTKKMESFFSSGLIYKNLLSVFYWFGVFYIFKRKVELLYPLCFFIIFEMVSLVIVLTGLHVRLSLPHFAFIYIIAFWFMDQFDLKKSFAKPKTQRSIRTIFSLSATCVFMLIFAWNYREKIL